VMAIDVRAYLRDQNWIPTPRRPRGWTRLLSRRQRYRAP
jgi:hypothetical protein